MFGRIHRAQSVTLLYIAFRIGVVEQCCQMVYYNTIFRKDGVISHACVHGRRRNLSRGASSGFYQMFFYGVAKTTICLCVGKVRATLLKILGNFKRFKTIPSSELLLNLIQKMKCLTDHFQLCLCFCIGNTE